MNRGTALKWADLLEQTPHKYDYSQLAYVAPASFDENDTPSEEIRTHMCPLGVLADFLDPSGWEIASDGVTMLFHGEQFSLPESFRKRCKMKTDGYSPLEGIASGNNYPHEQASLASIMADFRSHKGFAEFVRTNYAAI